MTAITQAEKTSPMGIDVQAKAWSVLYRASGVAVLPY